MTTTNTHTTDDHHKRLRRLSEGRMVGGVAAGLARYFDIDVVVVRVALVALALFGGVAIPLYVAAWLLVPEEGADSTIVTDLATDLLSHR